MGNGSWHTYGLLWDTDKYRYYFDGQLVWTHTTAVSHRSEYLILSSEAETDSWAGDIPVGGYGSAATRTSNMLVYYVRTYVLAPDLPGDYNGDGSVDAADHVLWLDFGVCRANFGRIPSGGSAAIDARFVPEPTAAMLLIVGGAIVSA